MTAMSWAVEKGERDQEDCKQHSQSSQGSALPFSLPLPHWVLTAMLVSGAGIIISTH